MKRRTAAIGLAGVLLVGLAAFGVSRLLAPRYGPVAAVTAKPSTCADTEALVKLSPSQIAAANQVCFSQSLAFSGELNGAVSTAFVVASDGPLPAQACSEPARWDGYPQASLALAIDDKTYRLHIAPPGRSEHQALTLNDPNGIVELGPITNSKLPWNQVTGSVVVNPDGVTGSIDVDALQDVAGAKPVHIKGQWACGSPPTFASFDPSVPCAAFYAMNQLPDADVARIKANGCHAQDLTFSGDVTGRVDNAVTDAIQEQDRGFYGDNMCGRDHNTYWASVKFSTGDETFQLILQAAKDPSVTPGQYPAVQGGVFFHMVLYTGHADPANHGVFVQGANEWDGSDGTFTIGPDLRSGTIDATLTGHGNASFSHVHIAGSWRCG